jgi:DNA adenine methylase
MESTASVRPCGAHPDPGEPRLRLRHPGRRPVDLLRIVDTLAEPLAFGHRVYVEPFGGVDPLLLRKPRSPTEVFTETYRGVANLLRVMRDPLSLVRLIERLRWPEPPGAASAGRIGKVDDPIEQARRMLLRFRAQARSGRANRWSVPRDADYIADGSTLPLSSDWTVLPETLRSMAARLRGVIIENRDPLQVIVDYDSPRTLFYISVAQAGISELPLRAVPGGPAGTRGDDSALAAVLARIRGQVILRGPPSDRLRDLYPAWQEVSVQHRGPVGCRPQQALYLSPGLQRWQGVPAIIEEGRP